MRTVFSAAPAIVQIDDAETRRLVELAAARDLRQRMNAGAPAYIALLVVLLVASPLIATHTTLAIGASFVLIALVAARVAMARKIGNRPVGIDAPPQQILRALTLALAAVWGALGAIVFHLFGNSSTGMLMLFLTSGISAGAASSLALDLGLARAYTVLLLVPLGIRAMVGGWPSVASIGFPTALFLAFVHDQLCRNHEVYWRAIVDSTFLRQRSLELERAKNTAEIAVKTQATFLAGVNHELRTPLHGVLGTLALLQESTLDTEQRDLAATAQRCAGDLLAMVNDVLDFTKFTALGDSLREQIRLEAFSVRRLVDDAIDTVAEPGARKGLDLAGFVDPDVPAQLVGDPFRLRQVLNNLLGNAVKFTATGTVTLRVSIRRRPESPKPDLILSVADTGIGIGAETRAQLFQPFRQADDSIVRRFGGTGLGLAIAKALCQAMDGDITLESTLGAGSLFSAVVRVASPQEASALLSESRSSLPLRSAVRSVLIVSRSLPSTDAVASVLGQRGHRVASHSGIEQIVATPDGVADVVLVDAFLISDATRLESFRARLQAVLGAEQNPRILVLAPLGQKPFADFDGVISRTASETAILRKVENANRSAPSPTAPGSTTSFQAPSGFPAEGTVNRSPARAGLSVLIADDNPVNLQIAAAFMRKMGHTPHVVADGQAALDLVRAQAFDVVLMDCQMPTLDGLEATRLLRSWESTLSVPKHLPVVAMTASTDQEQRRACALAGMDDFLSKPVSFQELSKVIHRLT